MEHYCLQLQPLSLAHGATLVLEDAHGVVIEAVGGLLWVTVTGEAGDVFLAPGQSHCVPGRGRVVIEGAAKSPSALRLRCPTAILAERGRPFLDQGLVCRLATALRWGRATA